MLPVPAAARGEFIRLSFMGNLKNIDCAVPILGTQNLKHTLGLGDAESCQRSPVLMLLLFFNSCTTKLCDLLYEAVVLSLFDSRNSTRNQTFSITGYPAPF